MIAQFTTMLYTLAHFEQYCECRSYRLGQRTRTIISDIPLDASNVLHLSMNCLSSIVHRVRRGTLPLLSSTAEDRSPAERFGVVDGGFSQICLGNFRGSDSAAAIP